MISIELSTLRVNGRDIRLEIYRPESQEPGPGILYLHELYGPLDVYKRDAQELAKQGYLVFLPDLYSGDAAAYCVRALVPKVARNNAADNPLLKEVHELLDALKADSMCNEKLGVVGMCLTGGYVIQAAMRDDVEAPVVFHHSLGLQGAGIPIVEEENLKSIKRMQGHWSRLDPFCPAKRRNRLQQKLGERLDAHIYNIPHGFRSVARNTAGAQQAWTRTLAFFEEHLLGPGAPSGAAHKESSNTSF
ncbi:MAG: dienelactone hydrolase family protein [Oceanococcus sp.]